MVASPPDRDILHVCPQPSTGLPSGRFQCPFGLNSLFERCSLALKVASPFPPQKKKENLGMRKMGEGRWSANSTRPSLFSLDALLRLCAKVWGILVASAGPFLRCLHFDRDERLGRVLNPALDS